MKKNHRFIILTLVFSLATSSINGEQPCESEVENDCSAYVQSSHSAHWSVYIPIAILIAGAIFFGLADRRNNNKSSYSSNSQNALGSMANPRRQAMTRSKTVLVPKFQGANYH